MLMRCFFFSSRRRHTRWTGDWSSDVCSSDLLQNGNPRQAVDPTFATNPNVPGPGHSLYRFSYGHGGLACEACHGSTHAEFPTSHVNDNLESQALQGHAGPVAECATCHTTPPATTDGGPHGAPPAGGPMPPPATPPRPPPRTAGRTVSIRSARPG